jgi:hypothetical protein
VELGKIEKPAVEGFAAKKKLYCISNVYSAEGAPDDYKALFEKYWDEVAEHLDRVESAGKVNKIFCEHVSSTGDQAFDVLMSIAEPAVRVIKKKTAEGAVLLPLEKEELLGPFLDWANCLNIVRTREVLEKVIGFYSELAEKRLSHAKEVIEGNLMEGEAGMLIMRDEDRMRLQFPADVEVFLVTPPSYDDIMKWFRGKMKGIETKEPSKGEH